MQSDSDIKMKDIFEAEGIKDEIHCEKAFEIAEKYGVNKFKITKFCNQNNIKIKKCQLGCFK